MALPWAHPASVLPLKRWCPKHFSFVDLVFGSMLPDFAYAIDDLNKFSRTVRLAFGSVSEHWHYVADGWDWDDFSHTFLGSIGFCLPVGLLCVAIFVALRESLVTTLPNPHRTLLLQLCKTRRGGLWIEMISLLVGVWLHIGWDSLTNADRWLAQHWSLLHFRVALGGDSRIELYYAFWFLSSLVGTGAVAVSYLGMIRRRGLPLVSRERGEGRYYAFWMAVLFACAVAAVFTALRFERLEISSAFLHRFTGFYVAAIGLGAMTVAVVSKLAKVPRRQV